MYMKKKETNAILNTVLHLLINTFTDVIYILISLFEPLTDTINEIFGILVDFSEVKNFFNLDSKKIDDLKLFLYYFLMALFLFFMSYPIIIDGVIYAINKNVLFLISFGMFFIIIAFIILLGNNIKKKIIKYFLYGLMLLFVPVVFIYWIAAIEQQTIHLYQLNSDQWIHIFEIFTTYFSACFIALVLGYKQKEND